MKERELSRDGHKKDNSSTGNHNNKPLKSPAFFLTRSRGNFESLTFALDHFTSDMATPVFVAF